MEGRYDVVSKGQTGERGHRKGQRGLALTILLVQTLAVSLVPVVHASTESLVGSRTIEAQHSSQCVPVHSESRCMLVVHSHQGQPEARVLPPATAYRRLGTPTDSQCTGPQRGNPSCNGERAPPIQ